MMKRKTTIFFLLAIAVLTIVGYALVQSVLGPTLPPSTPAAPITVAVNEPETSSSEMENAYPGPGETEPASATLEQAVESPYPLPEQTSSASQTQSGDEIVFQIVSTETLARFTIFEILRGSPKDVIGETNLVTGEIVVNTVELSQSKVSPIQINARGFATDDERRNSAIRNRILQTDAYEYILFTPTTIEGLNGSGEVGKTYTFRLTGDLTIREVTQPVTFEVTVVAESPTRLSGSATATIRRSDFNLVVPNVPFVASVADEVKLELIFVAVAK